MSVFSQTLKSKTVVFGYLVTALGILQTTLPDLQAIITPNTYGILTTGVGFAIVLLRAITTTSLADK